MIMSMLPRRTMLAAAAFLLGAASALTPAQAQVNDELNDFWLGVNENANITGPRADIGQEGGYFTGGSLVYRAPQDTLQPFRATGPSIRAGCGGIDIFTGGFGFVDSDQLVAMLRSVASNAQGYAFQLALETVCPQCAEQVDKLNALAQAANEMNINSCEAAQTLVNSAWPRQERASRYICETTGARSGRFSDFVSARHGCGAGGQANNQNSTDPNAREMTIVNKNIAWEAITELPFFNASSGPARRQAEFIMSLTGTQIITAGTGADAVPNYDMLPSLGNSDDLLNALFAGGEMELYRCDEPDDCLAPTVATVNVAADEALGSRTRATLEGILSKIQTRTPLSVEERAFLNSTSIPVYKILSVSYAHKGLQAGGDIPQLSEYIALELVSEFVTAALEEAMSARTSLEMSSGGEEYERWRVEVREVQLEINRRRAEVAERYNLTSDVIANYQMIERVLAVRLQNRAAQQLGGASWGDR